MAISVCLVEDQGAINFNPLTLTRPVFDLHCGIFSLKEKTIRQFPGFRIHYVVRDGLKPLILERSESAAVNILPEAECYFLNGRFISDSGFPRDLKESTAFICDGEIAGAFVTTQDIRRLKVKAQFPFDMNVFGKLPMLEIQGKWLKYAWDLIHQNPDELKRDFSYMGRGGQILGRVQQNVTLVAQERIYLAPGAQLQPGVVLNAESGPIYIDEAAVVMANSVINGPAFIGRASQIKIGAKIYEGTSIGDVCKVGGEVEGSIIHGYSNKQHEGFLGHAYLGSWCNLGADTNNSDLKNNYGMVRAFVNGELVDTGSQFMGLIMGDHTKCGINTMFITGCVVGVMANIFGAGFTPKAIPSFTWGGVESNQPYAFEKSIETAKVVMKRRKQALTTAQIDVLRGIFEQEQGS